MNPRAWALSSFLILAAVAEAAPPYREKIPAEKTQAVRSHHLEERDTPVPVGAKAPRFAGAPTGDPLVLVFYRGHW